uniref:androgen-dependent TFPI-regulating protein n=1 Tax=Jaculus jaculus TaxID=51337 RepID=UPI001E1B26A8|nr:androgen-dependent TFPI-regulating protein [Jaculus jaculus]
MLLPCSKDDTMTKTSTCIYHFLLLNWYIFLNYYIPYLGKANKIRVFPDGAHLKYLTLLNLLLQAVFFGVTFLDDVLKRVQGRKHITFLTSCRDLLFTVLAFPVSTFVFVAFWSVFLYDRDLIYPRILDEVFPGWINHAMHTWILPFQLVEVILRPHRYPSKKKGLTLLGAFSLGYVIRVLWLYAMTGSWVYPVFTTLSPLGIVTFCSAGYILTASIYLLGEKLNHWKWGDMMQSLKEK